jgi:hypothetical protein
VTGTDDFSRLARDLSDAGDAIMPNAAKAVGVSSNNIKRDWQGKLAGEPHLPHAARSITYDVTAKRGEIKGEIGAEKGRLQAPIVVVIESGSPTSAPRGYGTRALADETDGFEQGIEKARDDALRKAGL